MTVSGDHADAKRELRHSFSLRVAAAGVGMIATFLLTVIVVRSLDPRDTAAFFAILAALQIGSVVGRLGLGPNVIRLIPSEPDAHNRKVIAGTHLRATVLLTIVSAPVIAACATVGLIGHGDFIPCLALTTAMIAIETVRMMLSDIFAAVGRVRASVATMHYIRSMMVVPVIALVAMISPHPTLITMLYTYAAVAGVQLLIALWVARSAVTISGSRGLGAVRKAIDAGTRLFSLDLTGFVLVSGTIWLANAAFHPLTATHYSAAATIAGQVTILESLAALAVTPPAARLWALGRKREVVRMLSNLATVNVAVTLLVVAVLAAGGDEALEFAYGPSMRDANILLVILAIGGVFQAAFGVNISLLIIAGHINELSRTALVVLVIALPALVAAAFIAGPMALAITSSCGFAALWIAGWLTANRQLDQAPRPHRHLVRAIRELVSRSDVVPVDDAPAPDTRLPNPSPGG
jgi:O-antigen/teichoic acid export membrane protein